MTDPANSLRVAAANVARSNGATTEDLQRAINDVYAMARESQATEGECAADDRLTDLMTSGLFTEVDVTLHMDLAVIGLLAERGFITTTGGQ